MGEIVNLRRVKKRLARDASASQAAENRARAGMTKAERVAEAARRATEAARLDAHALPPKDESGG